MIGTNHEAHLYYKVLHHVHDLEKIREQHNVTAIDFENMVLTMFTETRRANIKNQSRLWEAYQHVQDMKEGR